jgi:uncharacterized protein YjbI with pentapeptide repeats/energy-coupling factor transporter ATP-binding protein EcfA2
MASSFGSDKDDKDSGKNNENRSESNKTSIITDEPITDAPDFDKYSETLSNIIINSLPRFTVGIYGRWGTGKTTLMQMIKGHLDEKYKNDTITVWFDAWRYENEEFSALVPLVRTLILHLEKYIHELEVEKNPKKAAMKNLTSKFKKMGEEIMLNSKAIVGADYAGTKASIETDFGKAVENYRSKGSFFKNERKIYFHTHISDHLKDELKNIRMKKETENLKVVIFIDDLDRCTPQRALEILESVKTFFDIEGIIFVIGIDPSSIDPIIKTKYGENSRIDGMKYLQKIVQLPYTIPLWNPPHLSGTITGMIRETRLPENVIQKVLDTKIQELIIKATELNPRDVKRFINSIVISHEIYGQGIDDIEKIIVIQAFYFHGDKWIEFLELLIPYKQRIEFVTHFILWLKKESTTISNLYDLNRVLQDVKNREKDDYIYKSLADKSLLEIYKKLIDIGDDDLFIFLRASKETLLRIDKIERYLRVMDPIVMTSRVEKSLGIDSGKQLHLLRNRQVKEFNQYSEQGIPIHLPFEFLVGCDLHNFNLYDSMLFRADLTGVNLVAANLYNANLSEANLSKANLSKAKLLEANLSGARLSKADLSGADLSGADLSGADLSEADLSEADLSGAYMSGANLYNANLSWAHMSKANLSGAYMYGAKLSKVNLSKANLSGAKLSGVNLTGAILSGIDLSGVDLSRANLSQANLSRAVLFNAYLPETKLPKADLFNANLSQAYLYQANLSGANLSKANLSNANLSQANLSKANLSKANLSQANLSWANLSRANLSQAYLPGVDLHGANLSQAVLSEANLSQANLPEARLSGAILYKANLSGAILYKANLSEAVLSEAVLSEAFLYEGKLSKTILIYCKFNNAVVNDTDFSDAVIDDPDFLKYLHEKGSQNIPDEIKNKKELRGELSKRGLDEDQIEYLLSLSQLPEIETNR